MSVPTQNCVRFEGFEADLRTEELSRSGRKIRLPHQSFRVLAMLLERKGELVTRDELRAQLWPVGRLVEYDQGLNAAVNRLREALGDSAEAPRFIETLPKRGYRFIASVHTEGSAPAVGRDVPNEPPASQPANSSHANSHDSAAPFNAPPIPAAAAVEPTSVDLTRQRRNKLLVAAAAGVVAIVLIAAVIAVLADGPAMRAPSGPHVVPFTSLPGRELAPTFSPDGNQIAFAWNGETGAWDQFDLYVKSLGSERLLRLTHQPSLGLHPAWSPDGRSIAFVRRTREGSSIFVIPALGGSERSIASGPIAVGTSVQISWSPDGRELAYSAYGPTGAPRVYFTSMESMKSRPLSPAPECVDAGAPAFSPDGKQLALACVVSSAVYVVYVAELPEGPVRPLARMMGYPQGLTWSADGSRLVLSNDSGEGGELWQLTLGGKLTRLPFGEEGSTPALAARGGRMAYVRGRRTIDIWRADLTAASPEQSATKLIYSTRVQTLPRYSPDGTRIAFQSNRSGSTEIWIADAEGANPDQLTSFNGPFTSAPSWCSDGRRIAFDSRASGVSAIYIEDINERVPRRVVTTAGNLSLPAWSRDCRWLFAPDATGVLYRFPSAGGKAERVTRHPSLYASVSGDRVVFNVLEALGVTLWSKPVSGGREAPLENLQKISYGDAWVSAAAGVYYTDSAGETTTVNFYDFASRATRTLMTLKQASIPGGGPGIAVSPDGRWLLYTQIEDEQSDIMLAPGQ
jgi:Tol biopolymer transport system component/DNA-binding winged helix-turn-helix (wHTH) protein